MGAGSSVGSPRAGDGTPVADNSPIVSVQQASAILSVVFSKQVTHNQLREFLATVRRDMLDDATVREILAVLDGGDAPGAAAAAPAEEGGEAAAPQQRVVGGDLAQSVRDTFFGQFDTVKQAFHAADVNGGGSISHEEFAACVRAGGLTISDEDVETAAQAIDTNNDGSINYTEFLRFLTNAGAPDEYAQNAAYHIAGNLRVQIRERFKSMREAFISLDPDRSGSISTAEVQKILRGQNFGYTDEDINLFVASYPHVKDGGFSYAEFCKMVEGAQPFVGLD